jgi:hypothetical protein
MYLAKLYQYRRFKRSVNEIRLLHEASTEYPHLTYAKLSSDGLAQIARDRGVDFATALFYDRIRRSQEHGPFITEVEALEPDLCDLPQLTGKVLIAPSAYYREHPELGGDGFLLRQIASDFGLTPKVLPVQSTGSVSENAQCIRHTLATESDDSVVLVSLSKGSADVRVALAEDKRLCQKVRAWVQICGVLRGSPELDTWLDGSWVQRWFLRAYLAYTRASMRLVSEMTHRPGSLLSVPVEAPPGVHVISIVGFPLTSHLTACGARARHQRMAHLGPNDGLTLLRDAILEPGLVYPVWGADHYFHVPDASRLLYRLFLYLSRIGVLTQCTPTINARRFLSAQGLPMGATAPIEAGVS